MTFTTLTFLLFSIVVFALYWSARACRGQNLVLLVASYVFYGWWDPRFCVLLLASSMIDFWLARAQMPEQPSSRRRWLLALSCVLNLGLLGVFKYYGFFVDSFAELAHTLGLNPSLPTLRLVLPVGISFYTFQTLSYTIDVYRRELRASERLLDYLAYVALFPQLVAGPIERAGRLLPQLQRMRVFDEAQARDGAKLILWGFCKKIIFADHLGEFVELIYTGPIVHASGPVLLVATICFAFQIYCDFSAYSDIAQGSARLLGIELVRNFAHPYFSRSVSEFWRRWHMSLSTWFRDYVYVPLGGSRHGRARLWLASMLTFTLSGLWHGANWTFVMWGAVNGLLVGLSSLRARASRLGPDDALPSLRTLAGMRALPAMLGTFLLICLTWVLFRAEDLPHAMGIYAAMFGDLARASAWTELIHHREFLGAFGPLLAILVLVEWLTRDRPHPLELSTWPRPLRWLLYTALCWATIYLMPDEPGAFIYFQLAMRRFVIHALAFALLQLAILVALWRACPDDPDHYMAATLDKHARLRTADSPRVIFVGGSSVGFSIDSRPFESLGLAPVNMGLNDGLGLAFMLGEVESQLQPGDVVIIAPETHLFWTSSQDDAVWAVLQRRPASLACLAAAGPRALADVSDQGLHFFARKVRCAAHQMSTDRDLPTIYRRSSFDHFGDFVAHRGRPGNHDQAIDRPWPAVETLDIERSMAKLRAFADTCEDVGAHCFVAWCPIRSERLLLGAELFELLETRLREDVGLPMLESPDEAGYAEDAFYDRGPHLSGEAAAARSARLAARLEQALHVGPAR